MRKFILAGLMVVSSFSACNNAKLEEGEDAVFVTSKGLISVRLYDETPLHKENFLKLASEGYYDGVLFHRVIKDFMIQTGDPNSKNADANTMLGTGGPEYKIPAEIKPEFFHKRGALAAARQGDNVNPEKASSGSQFYIVHGKIFNDEELDAVEFQVATQMAKERIGEIGREVEAEFEGQGLPFDSISAIVVQRAQEYRDSKPYAINPEFRQVYKTLGGTPHLDGEYTVFGEIVRGMEVVEAIATSETGRNDRPKKDIKIEKVIVRK